MGRLLQRWLAPAGLTLDDIELRREAVYTFRAAVAQTWRSGRVFLLGDAAHLMPPFVGQGLGAGLRDAHNLAWKLHRVLTGVAPEQLLDTYQAERLPHVTTTIRAARLVGWAITGRTRPVAAVRKQVIRGVNRIPGISRLALRAVNPPLRAGPLVGRHGGHPCPELPVVEGCLDDHLGDDFVVLSRCAPSATKFPIRLIHIGPGSRLWSQYPKADAVLVRPDRVVLGVARGTTELATLLAGAHRIAGEL